MKISALNADMLLKAASNVFIVSAFGLILPIVLVPVIYFVGYSEIVEELAKTLVILFFVLNLPKIKWQIFITIFFGFLFGLSESVLYLNNILQIGNLNIFWQRFLTAVPMHIFTALIILFFGSFNKKFISIGFIVAIILHVYFNILILG